MYNNAGYSCLPGCCCIDEFDKMGSQHQALLEAMVTLTSLFLVNRRLPLTSKVSLRQTLSCGQVS